MHSSQESFRLSNNTECDILSGFIAEERPITIYEACGLRYLLFGCLKKSFTNAWTGQSFHFRSVPPYGFLQKRAGPCGVLAAVQASVIYELFYSPSHIKADSGIVEVTQNEKREALARALTSILWQAGDGKNVIVAKRNKRIVLNTPAGSDILEDGILEFLKLIHFECRACLLDYYRNYINEMTRDNYPSCILFLYSVIMTHGFEKFKQEMDSSDNHLIGTDGYCSQEVVNLMLTGRAVSNLFDGVVELNSGGSDTTILQGIRGQSKIGLLSLYEYQGNCTVGNYYKNPVSPIWIMLADSHFTVLFALSKSILRRKKSEDPFILFHYNGLSRRYAETSYLINPAFHSSPPPTDRTLPSVVCCIYTSMGNHMMYSIKNICNNQHIIALNVFQSISCSQTMKHLIFNYGSSLVSGGLLLQLIQILNWMKFHPKQRKETPMNKCVLELLPTGKYHKILIRGIIEPKFR